ncbi:transcription-repair coupling factor [Cardinium endosymbiont of Culicoides punctatus]|uniref:transcription-repair coupling factor n=1 Tax=Cardinium endosymbiont of Culicoides punctatus TaxID=2304601 RepID=UPI001058E90C|nr:transcription-repair coupling factor [Cardinium endosymbiont of Culicoides punctatus]TDG95790.1 Transcription-repair-coupling factor [Cardinium endosymbiont of Culicoides punctatus]
MQINDFIALYKENKIVKELSDHLSQEKQNITLHLQGIVGSLDAILITAVQQRCPRLQLVVLTTKEEAWDLYGDFRNLLAPDMVLLLPCLEEDDRAQAEGKQILQNKRIEVIHAIATKPIAVVITYMAALAEKILDQSQIADRSCNLQVGQTISLKTLESTLRKQLFTKVDFVYKQGQFAVRGGIVDVYTANESVPYRIELWGNAISSIRTFDPDDQRSFKAVTKATILSNQQEDPLEKTLRYTSFASCLPTDTCIWIKNKTTTLEIFDKIDSGIHNNDIHATIHSSHIPRETKESFMASIDAFHQITFGTQQCMATDKDLIIHYPSDPQPYFKKKSNLLIDDLCKRNQDAYNVLITAVSAGQFARLDTILQEKEPKPYFTPLLLGLREGYIDHTAQIVCYTDHQIFNRYYQYQPPKHYSSTKTVLIQQATNLQVGDYVVHSDYGIGLFSGLHTLHINGYKQEAVRLIYKNNDMVYVNVSELYKISKYTSKHGTPPNMHKLGTTVWQSKKSTVKKQIKDIAKELITLYAERKNATGFSFGKDTYMDAELASSFCYEDTPDQALAIAAVKEDMERPIPMDRLICGDVGFGKTEIAIRAAFKAAENGKQVAVLVPTTILALQHYNSFMSRLADLPVNVSYINRFKTTQEISQVLTDTNDGKIDILIGTHKLLTDGVKFKDLGLLIIDEEQKFGVTAKEKLRQLRAHVDTLTLTATPIPRTLHFSLMGARDLSILHTPPANRRPVQTKACPFSSKVIQEAIQDEIARGGQVFFVHNKVNDINTIANKISSLVPTVRICIAHGQMAGTMLEEKILQFIAGNYDVLVATSIIESGMDIPNANTIIINDSHLLGLSDLHQMRGRVGRSNVQAFCYLLTPPNVHLTPEAKLRLSALEEFSELGDGFKVAMRDLDIRGAGDLLGAAQSGFIADIGFETYCKILEEAVEEVKNAEFKTLFSKDIEKRFNECSIETDCESLLPPEYVQNTTHRMLFYKRLNEIKNIDQLILFKEELIDRFGPLPTPTETLLETVQLRWEAERIGFQKVIFKDSVLRCYLGDDFHKRNTDMWENIVRYMQTYPAHCQLKEIKKNILVVITGKIDTISAAKNLFSQIGTV